MFPSLSSKIVAVCLVAFMAFIPVGCTQTPTEVVQQSLTVFETGKQYVAAAQTLAPELATVNPELGKEVSEYAALAGTNLDSLIALCQAYIAKPSGDQYQAILNGVDALTQSVDAKVLAAAKITNPQSQAKVMAILAVAATSAHVVLGLLQQKATQAQLKAIPKVAGIIPFEQIKPYLEPARETVAQMIRERGGDPAEVFSAAGF